MCARHLPERGTSSIAGLLCFCNEVCFHHVSHHSCDCTVFSVSHATGAHCTTGCSVLQRQLGAATLRPGGHCVTPVPLGHVHVPVALAHAS